MENHTPQLPPSGAPIYTLAQSGTGPNINQPVSLVGKGSEVSKWRGCHGRSKKKHVTANLMKSMVQLLEENDQQKRSQPYWNTFHCLGRIHTKDGRAYGRYCKNRICTVCAAVRKATIINRYRSTIESWPEPFFLTLSITSVPARELRTTIDEMQRVFKRIKNKYKKRDQRGTGRKLIGVKALECNFNPKAHTYNPHFHILLPDKSTACALQDEWLKHWRPRERASQGGQYCRRVKDVEHDLIETFKYGCKLFTDPDMKKGKQRKQLPVIYVKALDTILQAMKGKRVFDRFGFNLEPQTDERKGATPVAGVMEWQHHLESGDWVDRSDQVLTNYIPSSELDYLLECRIDLEAM